MIMSAVVLGSTLHAQAPITRAGRTAGTERWLVMLSGRTFSLRDRLVTIRGERDRSRRIALLAQVDELTRADQDDFARFAASSNIPVVERFWNLNACVVEVAPSQVRVLRGHRHVISLYPDETRHSGTVSACVRGPAPRASSEPHPGAAAGSPADNGTDAANHDVLTAHGLIGRGNNAIVAVLDSGVDLDQTGNGTPNVHNALREFIFNQSRVLENVLIDTANGIECNSAQVDPYCPNQPNYPDARHGMGVAGIAVGEGDPNPNTLYWTMGHAPGAKLLSYAITLPGPSLPSTCSGLMPLR